MEKNKQIKKLLEDVMQYAVMIHGKHNTVKDTHDELAIEIEDDRILFNLVKPQMADEEIIEYSINNMWDNNTESLEVFFPDDKLTFTASTLLNTIGINATALESMMPEEIKHFTTHYNSEKSIHSIVVESEDVQNVINQYGNGENVIESRFITDRYKGMSLADKIQFANQLDATTEALENKERGQGI